MDFKMHSDYAPAGDQPKAIVELTEGIRKGLDRQTLLGVTGSGKTFTMANVIQNVQKPTLVIAHNKTLAAQLCNEFREFFPENAVEYFVSYYDYYQPEAYLPRTDTYIEKEATINQEIDRLRHASTQALLSRRDVIIVASVSCIYGLGSPEEYRKEVLHIQVGDDTTREDVMRKLVNQQFSRTTSDVTRGQFRVRGDVLEFMPVNEEVLMRLMFTNERLSEVFRLDPVTRAIERELKDVWIFPAKHFMTAPEARERAIKDIERELSVRLKEMDEQGKVLEYERLSRRTKYDLEMLRNIGYCNGIENYSRHFDGRLPGEAPYTLMSYFPDDFLTIIDESHVTIPQIGGMYAGDQARKNTLVDHGFRLPSAKDNRPLQFDEFVDGIGQTVYVSATPGKYEIATSKQVVEQIIRPTGLVDPETIVLPVVGSSSRHPESTLTLSATKDPADPRDPSRQPGAEFAQDDGGETDGLVEADRAGSPPSYEAGQRTPMPEGYQGQVKDIIVRVRERIAKGERALITTLTKKMAEDLAGYLKEDGIKVAYLHSDVETLERITILSDLRRGAYDVLVGVNLLREGLDLPEVSLIGILDADKEGFLRSETSLIQTIGRAARNVNGLVILYADVMTGSMERALKETARRREIQLKFNEDNGITPQTILKKITDIRAMLGADGVDEERTKRVLKIEMTASVEELKEVIADKKDDMKNAAKNLMFETAAILRDEIVMLEKELQSKETVPKKRARKK